jgi:hypothetical protein
MSRDYSDELRSWLLKRGYHTTVAAIDKMLIDGVYPDHWDFVDVCDAEYSDLYHVYCESDD